MEYIRKTLAVLCDAVSSGALTEAKDAAKRELSKYAKTESLGKNTVGYIGDNDYTVMLAAHIDELSFIVTDIDKNGFLTVSSCGAVDLRHLPSRRVVIHGKEDIKGVFCSVPPHLKSGENISFDNIGDFKIDSCLGESAKDYISEGDYVTFDEKLTSLIGNRVTGKSLDDRAGVVCLLELARRLSGKELPVRVAFALTDEEELGCRGAKTAAFSVMPDEAVAIDVTFGDAPDVLPEFCGNLGCGAMIGIAPILDKKMSRKFIKTAEENGIMYGTEIMSSHTGTDGDVIAVSGKGVRTGVISVPLRNMHTPCEVIDLSDIKSVCDILENYILSGGMKND